MAKSIFRIATQLGDRNDSIVNIATAILEVFYKLSVIDDSFKYPTYTKRSESVLITLNGDIEEEGRMLAECILNNSIKNDESLTVDSTVEEGIRFLFNFGRNDVLFSVSGRFSNDGYSEFNIEHFNKNKDYDFDWYFGTLKVLVDTLQPKYAAVQIILSSYLQAVRELNYPLGWVTFFSNEIGFKIPSNLSEVEYKSEGAGEYLILTKDDFTIDTPTFQMYKYKLLLLSEQIKETVPEFGLF